MASANSTTTPALTSVGLVESPGPATVRPSTIRRHLWRWSTDSATGGAPGRR